MKRIALLTIVLAGLASTAMASDRVTLSFTLTDGGYYTPYARYYYGTPYRVYRYSPRYSYYGSRPVWRGHYYDRRDRSWSHDRGHDRSYDRRRDDRRHHDRRRR